MTSDKKKHKTTKFGVIKGEKVIHGFRCGCGQSRWFKSAKGRDLAIEKHEDHESVTGDKSLPPTLTCGEG